MRKKRSIMFKTKYQISLIIHIQYDFSVKTHAKKRNIVIKPILNFKAFFVEVSIK